MSRRSVSRRDENQGWIDRIIKQGMEQEETSKKDGCAFCGTQAPNGALFCPHCGQPIGTSSIPAESISSEETLLGELEETEKESPIEPGPLPVLMGDVQILYEGTIRGLITRESRIIQSPVLVDSNASMKLKTPYYGTAEVYFVMKLEEGFKGVPDEILVHLDRFGYFGVGDKVVLQGAIVKKNHKQWNKPMYTLLAHNFYNESLQVGDMRSKGRIQLLYKSTILGSVTRESRTRVAENACFLGTYFAMKLEGNIGIEGIPEEILVHSCKPGYFGIGDKVILQGTIVKKDLSQWCRPMYLLLADHFYNESLKIGDEVYFY
jgi:hypothetical protein